MGLMLLVLTAVLLYAYKLSLVFCEVAVGSADGKRIFRIFTLQHQCLFIDRVAGAIIRLVASVCMCLFVCGHSPV